METRPRADAQPVKNWCGCRDCTRMVAVRKHSAGRKTFLPLNHRREIKRAGSFTLPAHAISTKNKHLLVIYSIPTRGFTAAVSVFRGTPPPKPLDCKIWLNTSGAQFCQRWGHPTGGEPRLSRARFSFVSVDIIEMSPSFHSQIVHLSFVNWLMVVQRK